MLSFLPMVRILILLSGTQILADRENFPSLSFPFSCSYSVYFISSSWRSWSTHRQLDTYMFNFVMKSSFVVQVGLNILCASMINMGLQAWPSANFNLSPTVKWQKLSLFFLFTTMCIFTRHTLETQVIWVMVIKAYLLLGHHSHCLPHQWATCLPEFLLQILTYTTLSG